MSLWGNFDQANNAPKWKSVVAGAAAYAQNYTHTKHGGVVIGTANGFANTSNLQVFPASGTTYSNAVFGLTTYANGTILTLNTIVPGSFSANSANLQVSYGGTNVTANFSNLVFSNKVTGSVLYANTTVGAFNAGETEGTFGVSVAEAQSIAPKSIAPGWTLTRQGTGPIKNITAPNTAIGYVNTDIITVVAPSGGTNASATFSTNSTGGSLTITIANNGAGFIAVNAVANLLITNATGGNATGNSTVTTFIAVAGGHAGRINRETLAVVKGMANNSVSGGGSTTP